VPEYDDETAQAPDEESAVALADNDESEAAGTEQQIDVDEEYDRGPIIAQWPVPVRPDDTPDTLAARVLEVEHRLLPQVVVELTGFTDTIGPKQYNLMLSRRRAEAVQRYLDEARTKSASLLAERPVVVVWPGKDFGRVIWDP